MSESPRLCYFTYGTTAGHYHYALNQLRGLHESHPELDIDVFYVGTDNDEHFPDYVSERHFVYTGSDSKFVMGLRTLLLQLRLFVYLLRARPDVVHMNTHLWMQWYTLCITVLLSVLRVPVVRTVHERTDERLEEIHPLSATAADWHFQLADHLVVHTDALRREFLRDEITTPTTVIRHGNYCCFRQYINDTDPIPYGETDGPIVLFFGVKEHKGIETFLDALDYAKTEFEPWVVGPINDGDEKYADRARSTDDIKTRFEFVPDVTLARYFQYADIVALPYKEGTTSGALHLALTFENAVITSDLPCFTEYITDGKTAAVMQEPTPREFARHLDALVTRPAYRRRLATAGLELVNSEEFDWNHIADQLIDIYRVLSAKEFDR